MSNKTKAEILTESNDMTPVAGTVEVDIPVNVLWECFTQANLWSRWNKCFYWTLNQDLILGRQLIWCFQPIRWWYLYKMPAIAKIVEVEKEKKVTWEVTVLPGFYARHTYHMEDLGNGRTRFGSWEKAMGWSFRLMRWFWIPHFVFVKNRSLQGVRTLEVVYRQEGNIDNQTLKDKSYRLFQKSIRSLPNIMALPRLTAIELAPNVYTVLGGGGNSLVIKDEDEVLLVDPKFPPFSKRLQNWISKNIGAPVTMIINTHYHYDHTQGNIHYPNAPIFAHKKVPELMRRYDSGWWNHHQNGVPTVANLIDKTRTLKMGEQEVVLNHPGKAHTCGDLWIYLRRGEVEIIGLGDLIYNTHYPFFDLEGGVDVQGLAKSIRDLASKYPNAIFLPGHGPLANASDLVRYADFLEFLYEAVAHARENGLTENEAVRNIDLSIWGLFILPIFHYGQFWATASSNIRSVYQMQTSQEA